jgi:hypothetical protein
MFIIGNIAFVLVLLCRHHKKIKIKSVSHTNCPDVSKTKLSYYRHADDKWEMKHSSYSFLTPALDGAEWSASLPGRALPLGKGPPVRNGQEAGWIPQLVCTQRLEEKSFASAGIELRSPVVQTVVRRYKMRRSYHRPPTTRLQGDRCAYVILLRIYRKQHHYLMIISPSYIG